MQVTRLPDGNDLQITWDNPEGNEGIIFAVRGSVSGNIFFQIAHLFVANN